LGDNLTQPTVNSSRSAEPPYNPNGTIPPANNCELHSVIVSRMERATANTNRPKHSLHSLFPSQTDPVDSTVKLMFSQHIENHNHVHERITTTST